MRKCINTVCLFLLLFASACQAEIIIKLVNPETFKDIKQPGFSKAKNTKALTRALEVFSNRYDEKLLKGKYRLKLDIYDVNLAGNLEFANVSLQPVRMVEDGDNVKIKLVYQLLNHENRVLAQGQGSLKNTVKKLKGQSVFTKRQFSYEYQLLQDWIESLVDSVESGSTLLEHSA